MKTIMIAATAVVALGLAGGAQASEDLAKQNGCLGCHAIDAKKKGPAFKEVAASMKGKADAEATIVNMLKSGKTPDGKSHPIPKKASEDDMKVLAKWVLSL